MNNKMRYLIVMATGVAMNLILHGIASHFHLPVWLDMTGTALAALMLEPAAGLLVGLVNNFCIAVFDYTASSLFYYAVSAAVALIVGLNMRRKDKSLRQRIVSTIVLVIVVSAAISTLLTLWRTGGISESGWEAYYYGIASAWGWPNALACFFGTFVIKIYDVLASAAIVACAYGVLPKVLRAPGTALRAG
ncbi:MAG: hypothetical protein DELT_03285 [Desulfovibrio sp.]|uniref:hypothetical protein n=1 Tax=Christensenella intestinihominis TaxID=1851429 RepID=UPI00082DEC9E|nr:hypothetical protein [Christensenella intestinihominis]